MNSGGIPLVADEVYAEKQDQLRNTMVQKFDELIAAFSASRVKEEAIALSTAGSLDWKQLEDGVYNISVEGYIADGHTGLLLKPGDVLLIKGNYAVVFTTTTAAKLHYDEDCSRYHYVSKIVVTKELLTEVLSELNQQHSQEPTEPIQNEVKVLDGEGNEKTIQEMVTKFLENFSDISETLRGIGNAVKSKQDNITFGEGLKFDSESNTLSLDQTAVPQGGGGAPAEHDHAVSDVYIPVNTGGEWDTDAYNIKEELANAIKSDDMVLSILSGMGLELEEVENRFAQLNIARIIGTDQSTYIAVSVMFFIPFLKSRLAPNADSLYDVKYGMVIKTNDVEGLFSGGPVQADEMSNNHITFSCLNHNYEHVDIDNIAEVMSVGEGGDTIEGESADTLISKYAGKSTSLTLLALDDGGQEIPYTEEMEFDEGSMFYVMAFCLVPVEDVASLMESDMGEEGMAEIKIHFDEIEEEILTKKPLVPYINKKIEDVQNTQIKLRDVTDQQYENLSESVKRDENTLFLITEE